MTGTITTQQKASDHNPSTCGFPDAAAGRSWLVEATAFVLLVGSGIALRLIFRDLPNFAPVAALALFAGYYFRSPLLALCAPLTVMAVTDLLLGGYSWQMMALVYGMLAVPVALRSWLREWLVIRRGGLAEAVAPVVGLVACGLVSSVLFFLVTNFGVWMWFGAYAPSWQGLWHCYLAALPFFRYTLTGDLFFAAVFFSSYALAVNLGSQRALATAS